MTRVNARVGMEKKIRSANVFCIASLLASSSHYVASRLAGSVSEMHVYTAGSSAASAAGLMMMMGGRGLREKASSMVNAGKRGRLASCAVIVFFVVIKYTRISLDGYVFRTRPMIYALASRNVAAAFMFMYSQAGSRAASRNPKAIPEADGGSVTMEQKYNEMKCESEAASYPPSHDPYGTARMRKRKQTDATVKRVEESNYGSADEARRRNVREISAAIAGMIGCTLLAIQGEDGDGGVLLWNVILIVTSAALQILHAALGRFHPSLQADAIATAVFASGVALAYGHGPGTSASLAAGCIFSLSGGFVGVLYCAAILSSDSAAMAKYAQASAVAKVLALPVSAYLMCEPVDISNWRTNAGAILTILAFAAR